MIICNADIPRTSPGNKKVQLQAWRGGCEGAGSQETVLTRLLIIAMSPLCYPTCEMWLVMFGIFTNYYHHYLY